MAFFRCTNIASNMIDDSQHYVTAKNKSCAKFSTSSVQCNSNFFHNREKKYRINSNRRRTLNKRRTPTTWISVPMLSVMITVAETGSGYIWKVFACIFVHAKRTR